jgi:hypothetical protein
MKVTRGRRQNCRVRESCNRQSISLTSEELRVLQPKIVEAEAEIRRLLRGKKTQCQKESQSIKGEIMRDEHRGFQIYGAAEPVLEALIGRISRSCPRGRMTMRGRIIPFWS